MEEYEYSFKVTNIKPFIEYCEKNNYIKNNITTQNRIVYENRYSNDIIARITTNECDGEKEIFLDCKNVGVRNKDLKISSESIPLEVTSNNKKQIESILDTLNFYIASNLYRTRYVYTKDNIKFEIDEYTSPKMNVIAIEGERDSVDKVYNDLKNIIECNNVMEEK